MAQVLTETERLCILVENLHYSAKRLMAVWPKRFPTLVLAREYEDDPEKLGNFVYANRMGNGDAASGEGFKYRGRGLLQITGKDAYARFGKQLGINLVANPELAYDPIHCLEIAAAEWAVSGYHHQFCNELADQDDVHGLTRAINGGLTGIDDRINQLQRCKKIWLPVPQLASLAASHEYDSAADEADVGAGRSSAMRSGTEQLVERAVRSDAGAQQAPAAIAASVAPFDPVKAVQYGRFVEAAYTMYAADPSNLPLLLALTSPAAIGFPVGCR
jgi:predicted chitinase